VVKLLSAELADLRKRLVDLRAESETTRLERQAAPQTIDNRLSLKHERMRVYERPLTRRQLEDRERHAAEQEQLVYHAWKWLKRDPSKDFMVGNGRVSSTGLDDVVPPWRVKECQGGRSEAGVGDTAQVVKKEEPVVKTEVDVDEMIADVRVLDDSGMSSYPSFPVALAC
jgi:hypothetical protein